MTSTEAPTDAQIAAAARALNRRHALLCNVDEADSWLIHGDDFREDARAALSAALAQPAASDTPAETHPQYVAGWKAGYKHGAWQAQPSASGEPLFLLHCGQIDSGGEQDDWETEADSGQRVDEFARQYPGKTVPLYAHPPLAQPAPARVPLTDAQINEIAERAGHDRFTFAAAIEAAHGITAKEAP